MLYVQIQIQSFFLTRPVTRRLTAVSGRLDGAQLARVTCLVQTCLALTLSWLSDAAGGSDHVPHHGLSAGVVASALLFMAGQSGSGHRHGLVERSTVLVHGVSPA